MASEDYTTIVLITGANGGIGFETAKKLGAEHSDYHIIVSGRRKDAVDEAVTRLQASGGSFEGILLDVTSDESIAQAAQTVQEKHGRLDVLVNNAGVAPSEGERPRQLLKDIFDINVFGVVQVTNTFLPLLEKSQVTKRIVVITSGFGSFGETLGKGRDECHWPIYSVFAAYSASKAALNMMIVHYAIRFEKDPTWKVNLCCPGFCATNLTGYPGGEDPANGAINACRLATLGPEGETTTFTNRHGPLPF
ncbi:hypothetical protein B0H63DRAFT_385374 [Podospora didyma]|uniref:Uncharacterized protein n=1 Tax=Podospora didyma TaxID=330526 RepID=A0AAE0U7X9_9PEZI|nr:hypothetical protein B0H63DRAFT_385374 [Podospora didyma]